MAPTTSSQPTSGTTTNADPTRPAISYHPASTNNPPRRLASAPAKSCATSTDTRLTCSDDFSSGTTTYQVSGRTWFDRQWGSEGTEPPRFTWLGLDLGAGRYLSVWDTTGDGTSWLTELKADGTHTITRAQRTDHNGAWRLTIPDLDACLEITHRGLPDSHDGLYAGVCSVTGMLAGEDIAGHGYTDVIG